MSPQQTHNILRLKKIFLFPIIIATQSQNNPLFKRVEYNKLIPNNGFKANSCTFYHLISVRLLHLQELHCVSSGRIFKNFYVLFPKESSRNSLCYCKKIIDLYMLFIIVMLFMYFWWKSNKSICSKEKSLNGSIVQKKWRGRGGRRWWGCQIFKYVKVIVRLGCLFSHGEAETYYL